MTDSCKVCRLLENRDDSPCWIATFARSVAFVYEDQFLSGRVIVVYKQHVDEITEVTIQESMELYREMISVAKAVEKVKQPAKLNLAMLGNRESHLHWHVIPRLPGGYLEGKAPWPHPKQELSEEEYLALANELREALDDISD